jgi:hypothetical protein
MRWPLRTPSTWQRPPSPHPTTTNRPSGGTNEHSRDSRFPALEKERSNRERPKELLISGQNSPRAWATDAAPRSPWRRLSTSISKLLARPHLGTKRAVRNIYLAALSSNLIALALIGQLSRLGTGLLRIFAALVAGTGFRGSLPSSAWFSPRLRTSHTRSGSRACGTCTWRSSSWNRTFSSCAGDLPRACCRRAAQAE